MRKNKGDQGGCQGSSHYGVSQGNPALKNHQKKNKNHRKKTTKAKNKKKKKTNQTHKKKNKKKEKPNKTTTPLETPVAIERASFRKSNLKRGKGEDGRWGDGTPAEKEIRRRREEGEAL